METSYRLARKIPPPPCSCTEGSDQKAVGVSLVESSYEQALDLVSAQQALFLKLLFGTTYPAILRHL